MEVKREELEQFLSTLLRPNEFSDYGPNGLQIEGRKSISTLAFAVSASRDSIEKAVSLNADALIVHHGLFWKFHGTRSITGTFAKRVVPLIKNDINLFSYHLPLDAHLEMGNAAGLAKHLQGLGNLQNFGDYKGSPTGIKGVFNTPVMAKDLKNNLEKILEHTVLLSSPDEKQKISSLGIITGGANDEWQRAKDEGLDAFITGEMSEHDWHEAAEAGIHMFAGGHSATEKFGVLSLQDLISSQFKLKCHFIDSLNPA